MLWFSCRSCFVKELAVAELRRVRVRARRVHGCCWMRRLRTSAARPSLGLARGPAALLSQGGAPPAFSLRRPHVWLPARCVLVRLQPAVRNSSFVLDVGVVCGTSAFVANMHWVSRRVLFGVLACDVAMFLRGDIARSGGVSVAGTLRRVIESKKATHLQKTETTDNPFPPNKQWSTRSLPTTRCCNETREAPPSPTHLQRIRNLRRAI